MKAIVVTDQAAGTAGMTLVDWPEPQAAIVQVHASGFVPTELAWPSIGGDIQKRSAGLMRAGGTLVSIVGPAEARPADGLAVDFVVDPIVPN